MYIDLICSPSFYKSGKPYTEIKNKEKSFQL